MTELLQSLLDSALVAAIAAPLGAWVSAVLLRRRYRAEIDGLRAEVEQKFSSAKSSELDNVRKANDILVESIVEPLRKEIKSLRSDVNKFRRAIEKIQLCPMAGDCPVSRELQREEELSVGDGGATLRPAGVPAG